MVPVGIILEREENVTLMCFAETFIDLYQWTKDGSIVGTNDTLKVTADAFSGGIYTCTVSNDQGSDSISTTVYVAPFILTPLDELTLTVNEAFVNVSCDSAGFPMPSVRWEDMTGVTVSSTQLLEFSPVLFGDEGGYRCVAIANINGTNFTASDETTLIGKCPCLVS